MSDIRFQQLKERTYTDFLNAGLQLILDKGYDAVTITEIAQLADYGRSTFYLHFDDKEDLVWALLKNHMTQLDEQILALVAPLESPIREWVAWQAIFAAIDVARPFFVQMEGELSRRLRQWQKDRLIDTFERQLQEGYYSLLIDVPPVIGARFIVGALLEILEYWLYHPEQGNAEVMAGHMFRLVFRQEPPQVAVPQLQLPR